MSRHISRATRRQVAARADFLCEYCLIAEEDTFFGCEVEHIIGLKHGGHSELDNLAYACAFCHRYKGSDIGSLSESGELVRFFNPRVDHWSDHFQLGGVVIRPLTLVGAVTAQILRFNHGDRVMERQALSAVGRYPGRAAMNRIKR